MCTWQRIPSYLSSNQTLVGQASRLSLSWSTRAVDSETRETTVLRHFLSKTIRQRGRYHEVEPDTVLEIAFDSVHRSDRHPSGLAMRFPRIARVRADKSPVKILMRNFPSSGVHCRSAWMSNGNFADGPRAPCTCSKRRWMDPTESTAVVTGFLERISNAVSPPSLCIR
ncbi:MAG: hypothetical protein DME22_00945 [Verrucomicrobia bacterium]|nr:MAG: hypothetical protein DME22_00945 [Verrucomicrobiota bacterium]